MRSKSDARARRGAACSALVARSRQPSGCADVARVMRSPMRSAAAVRGGSSGSRAVDGLDDRRCTPARAGGACGLRRVRSPPRAQARLASGLAARRGAGRSRPRSPRGTRRTGRPGEAQVGDLVELAQRAEDGQADLVGVDLGAAGGPDGVLDPLGEQGEVVLADRAALAGLADAGDDLGPAERLGGPGALDHDQAHRLDGGEAPAARRALSGGGGSRCRRRWCGSRRPGSSWSGRTGSAWVTSHSSRRASLGRTGHRLGITLGITCREPVDDQPQPVDDLHRCNY